MNDNDLITRREAELVLLEKGQKSKRYKLGETWELNFGEIREALSEYRPKIVRCRDCKYWKNGYLNYFIHPWLPCMEIKTNGDWFCADGERKSEDD